MQLKESGKKNAGEQESQMRTETHSGKDCQRWKVLVEEKRERVKRKDTERRKDSAVLGNYEGNMEEEEGSKIRLVRSFV